VEPVTHMFSGAKHMTTNKEKDYTSERRIALLAGEVCDVLFNVKDYRYIGFAHLDLDDIEVTFHATASSYPGQAAYVPVNHWFELTENGEWATYKEIPVFITFIKLEIIAEKDDTLEFVVSKRDRPFKFADESCFNDCKISDVGFETMEEMQEACEHEWRKFSVRASSEDQMQFEVEPKNYFGTDPDTANEIRFTWDKCERCYETRNVSCKSYDMGFSWEEFSYQKALQEERKRRSVDCKHEEFEYKRLLRCYTTVRDANDPDNERYYVDGQPCDDLNAELDKVQCTNCGKFYKHTEAK